MELQNFLRKNLSIIAITLFLILHQCWKLYSRPLKRRLSKLASKLSPPPHSYTEDAAEGAPYTFVRTTLRNSFLILRSTPLISKIPENLDHFQDLSFPARTFHYAANLVRVSVDSKNISKILPILRNAKKQKHFNTDEYLIENTRNNVATPMGKTYLSELYPSLARTTTNELADTEKSTPPFSSLHLFSRSGKPVKFTSKTDHNDRSLLSEKYFAKNEHQTQCYSVTTVVEQMPFSLMKETRSSSKIQIMNIKNAAAAAVVVQEGTSSANHLQLSEQSLPLIKYCIKEFCVLLEAKSNRKNVLDLKQFCYKHVLNVLGVCVFGRSVQMLTNSRSQFYDVCDDLHSLVGDTEKGRVRRYVDGTLESLGLRERSLLKSKRVVDYFRGMVDECVQGNGDFSEHSLMSYLVAEAGKTISPNSTGGTVNDYADDITAFLIAFSMDVMEEMGGVMSLILYELSVNMELQEKVRNTDKVQFNLEGIPTLYRENITQLTLIDLIIKETFETYPIDPVIQLACKQFYRIPETKIQINPKCVVLIPRQVLRKNTHSRGDGNSDMIQQTEQKNYDFIVVPEIQTFHTFVLEFVKTCSKVSLACIIQQYEFAATTELYDRKDITSCRLSTLPNTLPARISRVEKRGKSIIFAESLKAFHDSQNTLPRIFSNLSSYFSI